MNPVWHNHSEPTGQFSHTHEHGDEMHKHGPNDSWLCWWRVRNLPWLCYEAVRLPTTTR